MNPHELPVAKQKADILQALSRSQVIVVESPTGSGKTTQIPQILHHAGYSEGGIIGVTQPRRIAAVSVALFIARQLGETIPHGVGYKMRFEDLTDSTTRIKIMTDGILLQELKADYNLSRYRVIMVDEAHERSLNIDFILGLLKRIVERRPEFRIVVSSATINAETFAEYFEECPIVRIDTTTFPVEVIYDPPPLESDYDAMIKKIVTLVGHIGELSEEGDILVFLSGESAIKDCIRRLQVLPCQASLELLPLYSRLSYAEQERIFDDCPGKRKVVVATNIAETSVTIDGVRWVIDSGYAKMNFYNPKTFTSSLIEIPISKASCNQRRGRAGRTQPGVCHRLYTRKDFEMRPLFTKEEIYRTDLSEVVLRMTEIGIHDYEGFDFVAPPGLAKIRSAIETLKLLDAIDEDRNLTRVGTMMVAFPALPKHSRMIVESVLRYPNVVEETLIAASFLSANSPFLLPHGREMEARRAHHRFAHSLGDFVSYLRLFRAFERAADGERFCEEHLLDHRTMREISNVKLQFAQVVEDMGISVQSGGKLQDYLCAVARGLVQFVCVRQRPGQYRSLTAERIQIHPGSMMFNKAPQYIVAGEIVKTSRMYARSVSPIEYEWLDQISPALVAMSAGRRQPRDRIPKRDSTRTIKIGGEVFNIEQGKKGKVVILPFEKIRAVVDTVRPQQLPHYRGLRGTVRYRRYDILRNVKLQTILEVVGRIDPRPGIADHWPKTITAEDFRLIGEYLDKLLCLCSRTKSGRDLGFLSVHVCGSGTYCFRCEKSFHSAVLHSLAALETLADEAAAVCSEKELSRIGEAYRRLEGLL